MEKNRIQYILKGENKMVLWISKYECYDRFFKLYFSHGDDYHYKYDCPLCINCPFFELEYAHPCKLHREKLTVKPNKTWNDIKVLVESAYSNLAN